MCSKFENSIRHVAGARWAQTGRQASRGSPNTRAGGRRLGGGAASQTRVWKLLRHWCSGPARGRQQWRWPEGRRRGALAPQAAPVCSGASRRVVGLRTQLVGLPSVSGACRDKRRLRRRGARPQRPQGRDTRPRGPENGAKSGLRRHEESRKLGSLHRGVQRAHCSARSGLVCRPDGHSRRCIWQGIRGA